MRVGDLDITLVPRGHAFRLLVQGRIVGQETNATADEVRALAGYFHHTVDKEERHARAHGKDHDLR